MRKSFCVLVSAVWLLAGCATSQTSSGARVVSHNSDPIVQELLAQAVASQRQWVSGSSQPAAANMAHAATFTIFGPFGGPSPVGWNEEMAQAQAATARQFQGGTSDIQLVQSHVSDSLIVLITIERNQVRFAGQEGLRKWELRVTQVYQRDGTTWKVVHRHADPLVARRDLPETLELLNR